MQVLGNYVYDAARNPLGRGSFGTVWLGHHRDDPHFQVALKLLHLPEGCTAEQLQRTKDDFLREARILRRLQHPGIVRLYEFSWNEGRPYLVMDLLTGGSLRQRMRNGAPLSVADAISLTVQIAQALQVAHDNDVVHRDLKPDNVMLRDIGLTPVITDFGIARLDALTRSISTQIGTPLYMAPEQFQGRAISGRTDVYALGILFHELLTGSVPYWNANPYALAEMHQQHPLPQLPASLAPLQSALVRMLAKDPADRFDSAEAVVAALRQAFINDSALRALVGYVGSDRAWSSQLRALGFGLDGSALAEIRMEQGEALSKVGVALLPNAGETPSKVPFSVAAPPTVAPIPAPNNPEFLGRMPSLEWPNAKTRAKREPGGNTQLSSASLTSTRIWAGSILAVAAYLASFAAVLVVLGGLIDQVLPRAMSDATLFFLLLVVGLIAAIAGTKVAFHIHPLGRENVGVFLLTLHLAVSAGVIGGAFSIGWKSLLLLGLTLPPILVIAGLNSASRNELPSSKSP